MLMRPSNTPMHFIRIQVNVAHCFLLTFAFVPGLFLLVREICEPSAAIFMFSRFLILECSMSAMKEKIFQFDVSTLTERKMNEFDGWDRDEVITVFWYDFGMWATINVISLIGRWHACCSTTQKNILAFYPKIIIFLVIFKKKHWNAFQIGNNLKFKLHPSHVVIWKIPAQGTRKYTRKILWRHSASLTKWFGW